MKPKMGKDLSPKGAPKSRNGVRDLQKLFDKLAVSPELALENMAPIEAGSILLDKPCKRVSFKAPCCNCGKSLFKKPS